MLLEAISKEFCGDGTLHGRETSIQIPRMVRHAVCSFGTDQSWFLTFVAVGHTRDMDQK